MSVERIVCMHPQKEGKSKGKPCNRYIGDAADDNKVYIRCPKCGEYTIIDGSNELDPIIKQKLTAELQKVITSLSGVQNG